MAMVREVRLPVCPATHSLVHCWRFGRSLCWSVRAQRQGWRSEEAGQRELL